MSWQASDALMADSVNNPGQAYAGKSGQYFANARKEVAPLLQQAGARRVLELGCGSGATLAWLKQQALLDYAVGIELFADAASLAQEHLDKVIVGDIESMRPDLAAGEFDAILCLDVLEHLRDPWRVVQEIQTWLKPGGLLIASIPNVRNWHALLPLLFAGRWDYADAGILDRTHLRFFTCHSARALLTDSGLQITDMQRLPLTTSPKAKWANRLSLGLLRDFLTLQFLLCARKPGA